MREFDELITQLEKVRDAVWEKNKERGFETVTEFILCFADVFGHSKSFMAQMFPQLESMKNDILAERFEDANIAVLAVLAWLRAIRSQMQNADQIIGETRVDNCGIN
jgi:hypothetical protein